MTHLEGDPTPSMEWVDNPPFLMEGVTSTLLTEIKGGHQITGKVTMTHLVQKVTLTYLSSGRESQ